ncbi:MULTISPECIES: Rieske (2Fe-2S) protein [Dermabacter]|uniref:Rieske (2Fe-2S) protein n=1 Tax=Dermabacter TaxID=36739 RepID=UPI000773A8AC|nr:MULTISPECIES: non-heme iron oxygenase ferredoxin subunit [Dermabacter]MCT1716881.1 non-heme iron oxygenase ferredoxin subunit [Dermabacter hominis]MCT1790341.1 non-heme iron oxygenase ferredoxin subunit [Dermabacter hominis]MCT1954823.1 non-heme iron oxygenase ferredoxin subunit [Dermabacter hominis]MCT2026334.1 non-heme iron oxygenase ferredoxin subunit [Dermabacter hominis]MDU1464877.1 non-heme iron oxygenase ferredoxin subunit [Dermabacter sp.]
MSTTHAVARLDDLAPGSVMGIEVGGIEIALARDTDGTVHALGDLCTHRNVNLSDGDVEDGALECWKHGSQFDLRTGVPRQLPAHVATPVYPVTIDQASGTISVSLDPIELS